MKKITAFLAALLAIGINKPAVAQKDNSNNSLLWRISGKNLKKPSYLFGTIHMICPADYIWTDKMKQSLNSSDKVCLEMDLDDQSVMMQVAMGLMDRTGKKLSSYFTPEQFTKLKAYFKDSLGMDITQLEQMKPAALETMMAKGAVACDNAISYEENLMKDAAKSKKEIIGLEDPREQIAVLESMPVDTVVKQIMEVVENKGGGDELDVFKKMVDAYKKQDLPQLYNLATEGGGMGSDLGVFLDDRNKRWITRMPAEMDKASIFFAVGAGHLWGTNGVISLLRKDGYTVEPVK